MFRKRRRHHEIVGHDAGDRQVEMTGGQRTGRRRDLGQRLGDPVEKRGQMAGHHLGVGTPGRQLLVHETGINPVRFDKIKVRIQHPVHALDGGALGLKGRFQRFPVGRVW